MEQIFTGVVISLKFVLPILMIPFPFLGVWSNYFLDIVDGDLLQALGMDDFTYQGIDKAADLYSYVFMVTAGWRWALRNVLIILLLYRTVGQILFFATRDELTLFYFQNLLEPLMLIFTLLILKAGTHEKAYELYKKHRLPIWIVIIAYKMWNEWYLHLANIDLSTIFFGLDGSSFGQ